MISPQTVLNNRYRIEKQIGEGGFAKVYLATDLQLDRKVAIKILSSQMSQDPEFLERFKKEARAIASFEHPNILSIYDYGEFEGDPYLVMPYIDGGTLHERLKRSPLSTEEVGRMLEQMCSALDYAHERNVIHRDIKPQNMLMRNDGRLLLTDFGIAKLVTNDAANSMTRPMGTINYMSPEQFDGHVSRQSDIYSQGVVLYQMLTGQLPFSGSTSQVLSGHYNRPVPSLVGQPNLQNVSPTVVRGLDEVIGKAMAKSPQDRYRTAGELSKAYQKALTNTEVSPFAPTQVVAPTNDNTAPATIPMMPQNYQQPGYQQPGYQQPGYQQPSTYQPPNYQTQPNQAGGPYGQPMNYTPPSQPGYNTPPSQPGYNTPMTQPNPYGPGAYPPQMQPQPPAKKNNNGMLLAIGGGVVALLVAGIIGVLALGGGNKANPSPTAVAVASATAVPTTQAATTAAATTSAATTQAAITAAATTQAAATTASATTQAAATTQAVGTTAAAPTTVRPTSAVTSTPRPTIKPTTAAPSGSTNAIKPPEGYLVWQSKDTKKLNVEIAYPKDWKATISDDGYQVTIGDGGVTNFIILSEAVVGAAKTTDEYNAEFVTELKTQGYKPYNDTGARFWGYGGEKWVQSSYQKDSNRAWGLFALHRGVPYAVVLTGDDKDFDQYLDAEFSEMFNTLHFLDTSVNYFTGELKSYSDSKGANINYPIDSWEVDKTTNPVKIVSKDKASNYYLYDVTNSTSSVDALLDSYKDKLAKSGSYDNLKETKRFDAIKIDNNNQERSIRFTYTFKGSDYIGELLIRKKGNLNYMAVSSSNKDTVLDNIYFDIWRYMEFIK